MGSPASMPDIKPGDVVAGRFRVVEVVGKGGFSVVYRAYQPSMDRFVALKVLKPHVLEDEKVVERFRREALYVSRLSHPNTITLFDYGDTDEGFCYIAMEFLKGRHLGSILTQEGPMKPHRVWSIAAQVCQSLAEAHEIDLIHRDLKPANIFLLKRPRGERVKVLDFGLSKSLQGLGSSSTDPISPLTQDGRVFGTPMYMAPEQAMDNPIGPTIDVYAMGHIIYQMITGEARYAELDHSMDIMLRQIYDSPLTFPPQWQDSPFADVIYDCTRKAPEDRIEDAGALLERLRSSAFRPLMQPEDEDAPSDQEKEEKVVPVRSGHPPEDPARGPRTGSLGRHLDTLHSHLQEVEGHRTMRLAILDGLEGSGRDDILNAFLDEARNRGVRTVDETDWPEEAADPGYRPMDERFPGPGQHESAIFGELDKRRHASFARRGEALREAAREDAVVWSIPDLDDASAQTLAFLDWMFRDLRDRPAPVLILASLDRRRLRERTGLHRYTQGILGASGPHADYLTVQPGYTPPSLDELLAIGATGGEDSSGPTNELSSDEVTPVDNQAVQPSQAGDDDRNDTLRHALAVLALLGDEIPASLKDGVTALRQDVLTQQEFDEALERAERIGIIVRENDQLAFRRHTYAASLRRLEPPTPLQTPSAPIRAAELLIDSNGADLPRQVLDLAVDHFLEGGAPDRAAELLQSAITSALESLKLDDAREFLLQLVDLLDSHSVEEMSALEVRLQLGEIQGALEELGSAEDILGDALVEAEQSADTTSEARALKLMGDLAMRQNEPRRADGYYRKARLRFRQAGESISAAGVTTLLAAAQLSDGRPDEAADVLTDARQTIDSDTHPVLLARIDARLGEALNRLAEFDRAAELLEETAREFADSRWPDEQRSVCFCAATASMGRGDLDAAEEFVERGCEFQDYGAGISAQTCALSRVDVLAARDDLDAAADLLADFTDEAPSGHDYDIRPAFYRGDIALARGDSAAVDWFDNVQQRAREVGHTDWYLESLVRRAWALYQASKPEEACESLQKAQSFADHFGASAGIIGARARKLYFQVHQLEESPHDKIESCLQEAESSDRTDARIIARTTLADVLMRRDAPDEAAEHLLVARREAARTGRFTLLMPLHRRLAECGRDGFTPASRWPGTALGTLLPPTGGG